MPDVSTGLPKLFRGVPINIETLSMAERKKRGLATLDSIVHVTTDAGLREILAYAQKKGRITVDSETDCDDPTSDDALDAWKGSIELMQFGDSERQFIVWHQMIADWTPIEVLLDDESILKIGQNLKFDVTFWLVKHGITKRWWNVADAGIIEQVLGCGLFSEADDKVGMTLKMTSMDNMARRWLGLQLKKDEDLRTGWRGLTPDTIPQDKLLYAADDVCVPGMILQCQKPWIKRLGLVETVNLEHAALPALADIEARGMRMDMAQWDALAAKSEGQLREAQQRLDVLFSVTTTLDIEEDGTVTFSRNKNYASKDQLKDLLREYMFERHGVTLIASNKHFKESLIANGFNPERAALLFAQSKIPNPKNPEKNKIVGGPNMTDLSEQHWEEYSRYLPKKRLFLPNTESKTLKLNKIIFNAAPEARDPALPNAIGIPAEVIDPLLAARKYSKAFGTYGYNWHRLINPITGRLHYQIIQAALTTGRTSTWPNFQNLPSGSEYRNCFVPVTGKKFVISDWDQIEPRIIGHLTDCFAYKRVFFSKHPDRPEFKIYCKGVTEALDLYTEIGKIMGIIPDWMTLRETKGGDGIEPTKEGKKGRKQSKIVVLGLGYGTGKDKFFLALVVDLGEAVDRDYADGLFDSFWKAVPEVKETLNKLSDLAYPGEDVYRGRKIIRKRSSRRVWHPFANGEVTWAETLGGRKRFYRASSKGWWTTGRNLPVQGTGADILKRAIVKMARWGWENLPPESGIVNQVHDELIVEVEDHLAEKTLEVLQNIMQEVGEAYCPTVPISAAGMIATEWRKD